MAAIYFRERGDKEVGRYTEYFTYVMVLSGLSGVSCGATCAASRARLRGKELRKERAFSAPGVSRKDFQSTYSDNRYKS